MIIPTDLPDDIDALKAIILAAHAREVSQDELIKSKDALIAHLKKLIADYKRALYGAKSEKRDPEQNQLTLEDLETEISKTKAKNEALDPPEKPTPKKPRKPRQNRKPFPENLPRVEEVITPENTRCACGKNCQIIGEDVSERLDIIPATFRVIVTRRPKFACGSCKNSVLQVPAKPHLIEGGIPTEATIAQVIVSKFADHLPLYRQSQIYARQGVEIERSTLADWVGKAALELTPVYDALIKNLKQSAKLFMDETTAPVLDPGRGKVKKGYFWSLARDDRPWNADAPPGVAFTYTPGRSGKHASEILQGFNGVLQVDGYTGYNRVLDPKKNGEIRLAYCWAHARRKLFELTKNSAAPIANQGLKQIAELYHIESQIRGQPAAARLAFRQKHSKPKVEVFKTWLDHARSQVSSKSPTGQALKYIDKYWGGLTLFLTDGRIEMDNNTAERTIRPIALGRKNALFAGHEAGAQNWAVLASLIATCKLNGVEPHAYLTDVLSAIMNGHKQSEIDQLLPWQYRI